MSLTGALEAFPLPEVLQLLSRSEKSGALRVRGSRIEAKVFLLEGACTYATTRSDDNLPDDLEQAGLVGSVDWRKVERQEKSLVDVLAKGVAEDQLEEFVAERIYDILYRLLRLEKGTFEFLPGATPRYPTGQKLPVDHCLAEARARLAEWREVEEVIPGLDVSLAMVAALDDDRDGVFLDAQAWGVLSALRGAGSVVEVARQLGAGEFRVAKVLARLVRDGLVQVVDEPASDRRQEQTPEIALVEDQEEPEEDEEPPEETDDEDPGEEQAESDDDEEEDDGDETSLLRMALAEVVNPGTDEKPGEGEGDQVVMRRRGGLGAIARERRNE